MEGETITFTSTISVLRESKAEGIKRNGEERLKGRIVILCDVEV